MTDAGVTADLARALAATEALVAGIRPDQWAAPTPCTELDARGVLTHGWDLARATGQPGDFPDDVAKRTLARSRRQLVARVSPTSSPPPWTTFRSADGSTVTCRLPATWWCAQRLDPEMRTRKHPITPLAAVTKGLLAGP